MVGNVYIAICQQYFNTLMYLKIITANYCYVFFKEVVFFFKEGVSTDMEMFLHGSLPLIWNWLVITEVVYLIQQIKACNTFI